MAGEKVKTQESTASATSNENLGEEVEVEKIKEKYWDREGEAQIGVVQNRIYSKRHKFEIGVFGSNVNADPFLSTYTLGGSIGYHISEYVSTQLFAWNAFVSPSSALSTLQNDLKLTTNTNPTRFFYGAEVRGSLLYGKLSLVGKMILYFDAYISGGVGMTGTRSGNNPTVFAGIGSQIHVSQLFSVNLDYRFMGYSENITGQVVGVNFGQDLGNRLNLSGVVTLGVSCFVKLFD